MNNFKGKGKNHKGKKSGGKGHGKPASSPHVLVNSSSDSKGGAQRPGQPGYTGCFICGSPEHDFRNCPQRGKRPGTSKGGKSSYTIASAMMIENDGYQENVPNENMVMVGTTHVPHEVPVLVAHGLPPTMVDVPSSSPEATVTTEASIMGTLQRLYPGHAVLDSGATETVASLEAVEEVVKQRRINFPGEKALVFPGQHRSFRFGNGQTRAAESYIELPQLLDGKEVRLGIHTLDAPAVPVLISIQTLRKLKAVINFTENYVVFEAVNSDVKVPLVQSPSGHLLLDLTRDWMSSGKENASKPSDHRAYMEPSSLPQLFSNEAGERQEQITSRDQLESRSHHPHHETTSSLQQLPHDLHVLPSSSTTSHAERTHDHTTISHHLGEHSGSSMRLPTFLTLTSFACAALSHVTTSDAASKDLRGDASEGKGEGQGESPWSQNQDPLERALRREQRGGSRSPRLEDAGLSMLGS